MLVFYSGFGQWKSNAGFTPLSEILHVASVFKLPIKNEREIRYSGSTSVTHFEYAEHFDADPISDSLKNKLEAFGGYFMVMSLNHTEDEFCPSRVVVRREEIIDNSQQAPVTSRPHISENLLILNQAAKRFWGNADPDEKDTHPTNEQVAGWLVEKGFSNINAQQGAVIIRPEWAAIGRRSKK